MVKKKNKLLIILLSLILILSSAVYSASGKKLRKGIVNLSKSLRGIPYSYGGSEIYGFDCSGLVYYTYTAYGLNIPRDARSQYKAGKRVSLKRARPGDILVFRIKGKFHTGILIFNNYFIHAPSRGSFVREEYLNSFWLKKLKCAVTVI